MPASSGVAVSEKFGLAVLDVEIARQHGLAVLDDVNVRRAALPGGKDSQLNAITGAIDGALGAQQNLILDPVAGCKLTVLDA